MLRILTIAVLTILTVTLLLTLNPGPYEQNKSTGEALIGGEFTLTNHLGQIVTNDTYKDKPRLVYFGFTYCPDICPMGLATMQAAIKQMGADAPHTLFITVDPERDTPEHLAVYMQNFPDIIGLTGTPEQIKQAAKTFRIYYKKISNEESPEDYTMDHTSLIYIMDSNGKYLAHTPHTASPEQLVTQIQQVTEG